MNILVSSAGRRGALIRLIRESLKQSGGRVFAIDAAPWSSACRLADGWQVVPRFRDEQFFDAVVSICRRHDIHVIIPTHDHELPVYAKLSPLFAELDIRVVCSDPKTIEICGDKRLTHRFLTDHDLPSVASIELDRASREDPTLPFPLIVKPSQGSSSEGVHLAKDMEELRFYLKRTERPIVQRQATGREYTTNMFVADGRCVVAVPHWRVETRGGEVSKCMTVRKQSLIDLGEKLARTLPGANGPICFQAFLSDDQHPQIIEINARFGGGYPVAHQAGADFIELIRQQQSGRRPICPSWADGLAMTRWDDAVFWNMRESLRCA